MKKRKVLSININLVPKDPFFQTPLGKTLRWALSVGRYLVIFTELVVIVSFATRFTLDRQVTDLNDAIGQRQRLIESYGTLESDFRVVQAKIDTYKQIEQQGNIVEIFPKISEVIPDGVKFQELTIFPDKLSFSGLALSQNTLNTLITNMQLSKSLFNVKVEKIESAGESSPGYIFSMSATTKAAEVQKVKAPGQKAAPSTSVTDEL